MNLRIDHYVHFVPAEEGKLAAILTALADLKGAVMTNQEKINAIAQAIAGAVADLTAAIGALKTAVANGETLDFTAADAAVASLGALDTANPPPPAPPAP